MLVKLRWRILIFFRGVGCILTATKNRSHPKPSPQSNMKTLFFRPHRHRNITSITAVVAAKTIRIGLPSWLAGGSVVPCEVLQREAFGNSERPAQFRPRVMLSIPSLSVHRSS